MSAPSSFQVTLGLAFALLLLGVSYHWSVPLLEFNRALIEQGQWWRLLTGHWVHYGFYHLGMNLLAFILCGSVLFRRVSASLYGFLIFSSVLGVGLGLYFNDPELQYYAGLSGALHGLLVGGVLLRLKEMPWIGSLALIVITLKLIQEQAPGFDPTHPLLAVPISISAHLYGATVGLVCGLSVQGFRLLTLHPGGR